MFSASGLRARFAFVDQHLSTREYLSGKDYSIADVGLYAMTDWTPRVGFDVHAYSNLVAHQVRIANRDAVREVHRIEAVRFLEMWNRFEFVP